MSYARLATPCTQRRTPEAVKLRGRITILVLKAVALLESEQTHINRTLCSMGYQTTSDTLWLTTVVVTTRLPGGTCQHQHRHTVGCLSHCDTVGHHQMQETAASAVCQPALLLNRTPVINTLAKHQPVMHGALGLCYRTHSGLHENT
jgi:hypothetical protein